MFTLHLITATIQSFVRHYLLRHYARVKTGVYATRIISQLYLYCKEALVTTSFEPTRIKAASFQKGCYNRCLESFVLGINTSLWFRKFVYVSG